MSCTLINDNQISSLLPQVRKLARKLAGDTLDPDDVAQDVMLKLLSSRSLPEKINRWLFTVVKNTVNDSYRQLSRESRYLDRKLTIDVTGVIAEDDSDACYITRS